MEVTPLVLAIYSANAGLVKIGAIYHGLTDAQNRAHLSQPFYVLREATREEYLASVRENGGVGNVYEGDRYYAVSTD